MNFESMNEAQKWEAILEKEGLSENLISEEEKAANEGVEIVSIEMANPEAQEL